MSNVFVGRNSGRLAVFSLALLVLFAAGCAANKGGLLGTGLFKGSGLSEEELAEAGIEAARFLVISAASPPVRVQSA